MKIIDSHIHSEYSFDSEMPIIKAIDRAREIGLFGVAVTDHLDYDYPGYGDTVNFDIDAQFREIDELKEKFGRKIKILKGIEVGLQSHVYKKSLDKIAPYDFDVIIGSTHVIDGMDPYDNEYFNMGDKTERYTKYVDTLLENLPMYEGFDIFAHIDYMVRYAPYDNKTFSYGDFPDKIDTVLKFIIDKGLAFEVNTSTYGKVPMDISILRRYKELGGKMVSMGSDAHSPEKIGLIFGEYAEIIKSCGFRYITYFEKRQAKGIKI